MAAVGELLVSELFKGLFETLKSSEVRDFARQLVRGVDLELEELERKLKMIGKLLSDAENKQLTDEAVKEWLDDLRDWAYDAEDILDEFAYEALRRKSMAEHQTGTSKVRKLIPSFFNSSRFNVRMGSDIKGITSRLEQLCERRAGELKLKEMSSLGTSSTAAQQRAEPRTPSSSVQTEPAVYGRDEDKAKILKMVSSDEPSDVNFRVIAIVGTGGIGKTTLAREVYNDKQVDDFKFDIKAWVCISDDFDVLRISKALLESISGSSSSNQTSLNDVQVKLKEAVKGKKFLLVLDDVWNKNYGLWESLKSPFTGCAPGSKMIVTTRDKGVALTMEPTTQLHHDLMFLSDDDCWSLFVKHVENRVAGVHQSLEFIREEVVKKCKGLPLAARTLGGLLRPKPRDEWEDILNSKIWDLPEKECEILPVLQLSYYHLPSHLKRCFVYCAIFPKDYEFDEEELVPLWMAEGILQKSSTNKKHLANLGGEYFRDLYSKSIFQQSSNNSSKFVMHDLIHDLAQFISGDTTFSLEDTTHKPSMKFGSVRHASYICSYREGKEKFEVFEKFEHLRTFLPVIKIDKNWYYITSMVIFDLLPKFKKLRVLSLRNYRITQLPDSIGDLIHLRYLNFSKTWITSLPESLSLLFNLQTLILRDCYHLMKLPSNMRNLTNLCSLDIRGASLLKEMPLGMKELKHLRTLSNFIVGKGISSNLKDLKNLTFLQGELHISKLDNVIDSNDIGDDILMYKKDLKLLLLEWGSQFEDSRKEEVERCVLDKLNPHSNLEELTIKYYGGASFPSWVGNSSFSKIVVLKLENCEKCTSLPSLEVLSSLKDLTIQGMIRLKGIDFHMPLPSLEILRFENLQECEYWNTNKGNKDIERFLGLLHELFIVKCPKLIGNLPDHLPSLKILVIKECAEFVVSFSSLPVLCKVEIDGCKRLECNRRSMDFKSLNSMTLSKIAKFGNYLSLNLSSVEKPLQRIHSLASLKELSIYNCASLDFFSKIFFLPNLSSLKICASEALQSLPEELKQNKLERFAVNGCNSLTFIARGTLPPSLKSVNVLYCEKLQCLVDDSDYNFSTCLLEDLSIYSCPSITCISSKGELPMTLKSLWLVDCPKMESIVETFDNCLCLREIQLSNCDKLQSIPSGLHNLNCLKTINIRKCSSLISLPDGGLPNTILSVNIDDCENLEGLVVDHLHSLDNLSLSSCPKIQTPLKLPNSVTRLTIYNTTVVESLPTNLTCLLIGGCRHAERFCQEDNGMPTSLTKLGIHNLPKLEYLSSVGFQNLISLQFLEIENCPKLKSIPDLGSLTSLETLWIMKCPKLKSIPDLSLISLKYLWIWECPKLKSFQSLPSSLLELKIDDCPKLKELCKRGKGKYWSKIKDIPHVELDNKFIYD